MRFAYYLVRQASADDPDLATSNVFIGHTLTLTREVQETTKAQISLCEGDTRHKIGMGVFLNHKSWVQIQNSVLFGQCALVETSISFNHCLFWVVFSLLRQDHCLGDTTSTFELHCILYISRSFSLGGASHKLHAEMHVKHSSEDSRPSSSYPFGHFKIPMTIVKFLTEESSFSAWF